jgi:hypothetical protein
MRQSLSVQSHETVRLTVKNYLDSDVVILSEDAPVSLRHVLQLLLAPVTVVVLLLVLLLLQLLQPKHLLDICMLFTVYRIRTGFKADLDPALLRIRRPSPDQDPDQGF